jgi:PhzF family phenazine biosynthesis protein
MTASLTWVDAFTDPHASGRRFSGNQAAVCLPDPDNPLGDEFMQSLAFELGISETAFVTPTPAHTPSAPDFDLRWFTPTVEVDLCGHATLASAHALRQRGVVDGTAPVTFHTRSGPLTAAFEGASIELDFPADPFVDTPLPTSLTSQFDQDEVVACGRTGFFTVVVLADEATVRDYRPDLAAIAAVDNKALLITAAAAGGAAGAGDYVLRVFGPNVGIDEDPATGSAQCSAGPYWATALGKVDLVALQASPRGARFRVRPGPDRVRIAGTATTVFEGDLC